jgi:type II secretory pathway component PulF
VTRLQQLVLQGSVLGYALQKLVVLAPLYGLVFAGAYAFQGRRGEPWRAMVEAALHRVPVLGPARRSLALARLAVALETLLGAGVAVIEAWELAAAASGSPALLRVVREAKPRLYNGEMPSEMVSHSPAFIAPFANLYATGEVSGQLEDSLQRLNVLFQEEGSRKLKTFLTFSAGAIIFGVMLLIAWQVISFWLGYFQQIQQAIPQ